jgi:hypothetical protein
VARIPDLKRLTVEDFQKEDQPLVRKMAFIINSFHEQVRSALAGNLDFTNISQEIKNIEFTTGDNGQPLNSVSFSSGLNNRIQGIIVVRTLITSNNLAFANQMPVISWSQNNQIVNINNIGGLEPNVSYRLTLLTL